MSEERSVGPDEKFCGSCGEIIKAAAEICPKCGVRQQVASSGNGGKSSRSWVALLLLSFFFGNFGVDRFYVGKVGTGILKGGLFVCNFILCFLVIGLFTMPISGIWWLVDIIIILLGKFKDKDGKYVRG